MEDTQLGETLLGDAEATGRTQRSPEPLGRGSTVGRYVVLDVLGSGAMGVVYAAYDPDLDRRLAVKLLRRSPGQDAGSTSGRGRLVREAQALARLNHPNVVTIHDVGEHEEQVFLAMEFIDGITLRHWLDEEPRRPAQVLDVLTRAGRGLEAAHDKGLVHRDFKPDNVMLERDEGTGTITRVVVLDFGLATAAGESLEVSADHGAGRGSLTSGEILANLTRTGAVMGTPAYMSPEQHFGAITDASTDQFSFCVALYESLYGSRPFAGETLPQIAANTLGGKVVAAPASTVVPGWLRRVVVRGLEVKPADRWPSMTALLAALEADPTRRRRRLGLAGLGVVGIGLAIGAAQWRAHVRARDCEAEADAIDEVWNEDVRARVRESLLSIRVAYAEQTWSRLAPRLEARADGWREARRQTCLARGETEAELRDVQDECFDSRKTSFSDQLAILVEADQTVLNSAPTWDLAGALDECTEPQRLHRRTPLPDDPQARERVRVLRRRIARVGLLTGAVKYDEALALAQECVEEAKALDQPRLLAGALAQQGNTYMKMDRDEQAEEALEEAFFVARGAGADGTAAFAARRLIVVVGNKGARTPEGRRWARHAKLLSQAAGVREIDQATLEQDLAGLEFAAGNFELALELAESARKRYEQELGATAPQIITALMFIVGAYDRLARTDEAIATAREALERGLQAYGEDHPTVGDLHHNLGVALAGQGGLADAERHLRRALELAIAAGRDAATSNVLDNLTHILRNSGRLEEALELSERSIALVRRAREPGHPSIAVALVNHAQTLESLGRLDEATAEYREALKLLEARIDEEHPMMGDIAYTLAIASFQKEEYKDALAYSERALAVYRRTFDDDHPKIYDALNVLFGAGFFAKDFEAVLEHGEPLMKRLPDAGLEAAVSSTMIATYGAALRDAGRLDEAVEHLRWALEESKKPGVPPANTEAVQFDLTKALWLAGEHEQAREQATVALASLRDLEDPNPPLREALEDWLRAPQ